MFYGETWLVCSRLRSQKNLNCQWRFVYLICSESLKRLLPNLVCWCIIMSQIVFQKDWLAVFKVKVTVKDDIIKIWLFNILSELLIILQPNLVWLNIIKGGLSCEKIGFLCCGPGQDHRRDSWFQWMFTSRLCFLNCWTFYHQTWYGDASSWARLSFKKIGLLSSRSRPQWRIIRSKYNFLIYLPKCLISLQLSTSS